MALRVSSTRSGVADSSGMQGVSPTWARKGQSAHFPIPIALPAHLAVDRDHQGEGLGAALLGDALSRVKLASAQVAVRAVVVGAIDEHATLPRPVARIGPNV
jgi:GNAT superfamily N-acetyltransferase